MIADPRAPAIVELDRATLSDAATVYMASEDAAALRLVDGLIHRPLWTALALAGTAWATVELVRWAERQDRKRQAIDKRRVTMRLKKLRASLKAERRREKARQAASKS